MHFILLTCSLLRIFLRKPFSLVRTKSWTISTCGGVYAMAKAFREVGGRQAWSCSLGATEREAARGGG